jgi:hypothetical protein
MRVAVDLEAIEPPKCERSEQAMRLIGIERDPDNAQMSLQTFACVCGAFAVSKAAYQ